MAPYQQALGIGLLVMFPFTYSLSSSGCDSPISPPEIGSLFSETFNSEEGYERSYDAFFPSSYSSNDIKPLPLVFSFHGWGGTSLEDACDSGLTAVANSTQEFIVVHLQGLQDYPYGNPQNWGAWHFNGSTSNGGVSCNASTEYCYTSNENCTACDWTDGADDVSFVSELMDYFESSYCINTSAIYATGMSNGGMMTYQVGASLSNRVAAIAPVAGSSHWKHLVTPLDKVPVMDIHGIYDTTVPANSSTNDGKTSDGTWFYNANSNIFDAWRVSNECSNSDQSPRQYPTNWDGYDGLYCIRECDDDSLVRCAWNGEHQYFGGIVQHYIYDCDPLSLEDTYSSNGFLVWEWLRKHTLESL